MNELHRSGRNLVALLLVTSACATTSKTVASAMVVGTIHKYHLAQPDYPMTMLGALMAEVAPDLVLVEIRPEPFVSGDYEDGPLEMTYVTELAKARNVPVEPIDWWRDSDVGKEPQLDALTRDTCEQELADLEAEVPWPPTFEQANGPASLIRGMRMANAQARCYSGNSDWNWRQAWMQHHAEEAIRKHGAKRTLVVVGAQHRPEMEVYLHALGLRVGSPTADLAKLRDTARHTEIPQAVIARWRDGLVRLKISQKTATGPMAAAIAKKVVGWQRALDAHGQCCTSVDD
jgi:hypothetical protein